MVHRIYTLFLHLWDCLIYAKMGRWFTLFRDHGHQERILSVADHIVVLANGKVQKSGAREEVLPSILGANAACKTLTEKLPEEKTQAVREEEKA